MPIFVAPTEKSVCRHIERKRIFAYSDCVKLDTLLSNIGICEKDALLACIRISTRNTSKWGCPFSLSVLRGVQPYAADEAEW